MTYAQTTYHTRKAQGLCVRCCKPGAMKPNGVRSPLCEQHLREKQSYKKPVVSPYDVIPWQQEPPRAKYVPDYLKNLPALPADCPRCQAMLHPFLMDVEGEYFQAVYCICCGFIVDQLAWKNKLEAA